MNKEQKIAIIGLGYVGLPLARLFATKYPVVGFDINTNRIHDLKNGKDTTFEVEDSVLQLVLLNENPFSNDLPKGLFCSENIEEVMNEYNGTSHSELNPVIASPAKQSQKIDAIMLTVGHLEFLDLELSLYLKENGVVYDVKGAIAKD